MNNFKEITDFKTACIVEGYDPNALPEVSKLPLHLQQYIIDHFKLIFSIDAINKGTEPDWSNIGQLKYRPWWKVLTEKNDVVKASGVGLSCDGYGCANTSASVAPRLCFIDFARMMHVVSSENLRELYEMDHFPVMGPKVDIKDFREIKSYEDACAALGYDPDALPGVSDLPAKYQQYIIDHFKLVVTLEAINMGTYLDWSDVSQAKWRIIWKVITEKDGVKKGSGVGLSYYGYDNTRTGTDVAPRLCFADTERLKHAVDHLTSLFERAYISQD
jgi:hypothetical protein